MIFKSFIRFVNEYGGLGTIVSNGQLAHIPIPSRSEALALEVGDQVIAKNRQNLGVGTIQKIEKELETAYVQFYDDLTDSTFGHPDIDGSPLDAMEIALEDLFAVTTTEDGL